MTMLKELFALQDGQPSTLAEQTRCARWASLSLSQSRSIIPRLGDDGHGSTRRLSCIDIDYASGSVLLIGGDLRGPDDIGFVGAYAVPEESSYSTTSAKGREVDANVFARSCAPLAVCSGPESDGPIGVVKWLPEDPSVFLSGAQGGVVLTWDSTAFEPCMRSELLGDVDGKPGKLSLNSLDVSRAPGALRGVVAVACNSVDVRLLDLGSNSSSQCLSGHSDSIRDVSWSSTNPYVLATAGVDGTARVFDVRRSGRAACLYTLDMSRSLAAAHAGQSGCASIEGRSRKRRKKLLGIGTPWEAPDAVSAISQRRRRARCVENTGLSDATHDGAVQRVRFSPDGRLIVTSGRDYKVRVWDSTSGHLLLSSFPGMSRLGMSQFEVSGDSSILLSCNVDGIKLHDLATGSVLSSPRGSYGSLLSMVLHPWREELYTPTADGDVLCWAAS